MIELLWYWDSLIIILIIILIIFYRNSPHILTLTLIKTATDPVLTSGKEEKYVIYPSTLNCAVRVGKLRIYIVQNPPEILLKLAPPAV